MSPEKRVAIVQSNYVPWRGYFDLIASVDEFVLLDDVQYTRRDWRNRNRIKTEQGTRWLTIPVQVSGRYTQTIAETKVAEPGWADQHWSIVRQSYRDAAGFEAAAPFVEELYATVPGPSLSDVNRHFLGAICERLAIDTPLKPLAGLRGRGRQDRASARHLPEGRRDDVRLRAARAGLSRRGCIRRRADRCRMVQVRAVPRVRAGAPAVRAAGEHPRHTPLHRTGSSRAGATRGGRVSERLAEQAGRYYARSCVSTARLPAGSTGTTSAPNGSASSGCSTSSRAWTSRSR